jgi:hypothetical protein
MATVRVRIAILTVRITLSVCPFNRMAHTANKHCVASFCVGLFPKCQDKGCYEKLINYYNTEGVEST